jgi:diguanylate cyclase (GGDEF)-like protein
MRLTISAQSLRRAALLVGVAAAYFVAGRLGLRLAVLDPRATAVSPAAGIGLAALLLGGDELWPAILVGALLVHLGTTGSLAGAVALAAGDCVTALLGAYLVSRFARGPRAVARARDIFTFAALAGIVSTLVSASTGAVVVALEGAPRWSALGSIWLTRWLGDAVGDVVVAPAVLLWAQRPRVRWRRGREALEVGAVFACTILVGIAVFAGVLPWGERHYPLEFLCLPVLLWAAFRFGPREAATVVIVLSGVAIAGTLQGFGPFALPGSGPSFLLLQAFTGVTAVTTLVLAAAVADRKEAEEWLRRLAVSDPLTGLANYRELIQALGAEIRRSSRTDRPFAVVLLDLDGLKAINDRYGHLVGSLAVRRVAETLLGSCRGIDTAARFGGDEFALVLPETGEAAAWRVAGRVADRVARDGEDPGISVSVGVAVHPRDGASLEDLLNAADRSLYESKAHLRRGAPRHPARRRP